MDEDRRWQESALADLTYRHLLVEVGVATRRRSVEFARECGASWSDIGSVMGMTRQAAHKHFGHEVGEGGTLNEPIPHFEHVSMARVPAFDSDDHLAYHVRWRALVGNGGLDIISLVRRTAIEDQLRIATDI